MEAYLDNSATTKCFEEVKDIVVKTMMEDYGNPSAMHLKGVEAEGSSLRHCQNPESTGERDFLHLRWNRIGQLGPCGYCVCQLQAGKAHHYHIL